MTTFLDEDTGYGVLINVRRYVGRRQWLVVALNLDLPDAQARCRLLRTHFSVACPEFADISLEDHLSVPEPLDLDVRAELLLAHAKRNGFIPS